MSCPQCNDAGMIEVWENGEVIGVKLCGCRKKTNAEPQPLGLQQEAELAAMARKASEELGGMPDYPNGLDTGARRGVADALSRICWSPEQIQWVVCRALDLHRTWRACGIPGLRQILLSKAQGCRDGLNDGPQTISEAYPEGIPGEKDNLTGYQLAEAQVCQLPMAPRSKSGKLLPVGSAVTPELEAKFAEFEPSPAPSPQKPFKNLRSAIDAERERRKNSKPIEMKARERAGESV